jgi:hypothetical protein
MGFLNQRSCQVAHIKYNVLVHMSRIMKMLVNGTFRTNLNSPLWLICDSPGSRT